ncbi:MAG: hypothetical protein Q9223_002533 [Gallowayella weberi]
MSKTLRSQRWQCLTPPSYKFCSSLCSSCSIQTSLRIHIQYLPSSSGIPITVHQQDNWTLDIVDSRMCFHQIQKYGCGHEDKDLIPCEEKCDTGECSKPGQDQVGEEILPECAKCKYAADDEEDIQRQIREFTMKESLKPSAAPTTAKPRDPNAPKQYLIRCIEWERCKHLSHPEPTDIEWESEEWSQYMPIVGRGQCFDCSRAPAGKIAAMKQNGEYEKQDPWGAMSRMDVGEGSSSNVRKRTLEQIAGGAAAGQNEDQDFPASRSPSPEGRRQRSVSFVSDDDIMSDDDTGHAKGKSRKGEAVEPQPLHDRDSSDEEEEEEEEDTDEEESARIPKWSTASSAKALLQVSHRSKGAPHSHSRYSDDSDEESEDESDLDDIGHDEKTEKK